jgi:hypothetical protein
MKQIFIILAVTTLLTGCGRKIKPSFTKEDETIVYPTQVSNNRNSSAGIPDTLTFFMNGVDFRICPSGLFYIGELKSDSINLTAEMGIFKAFYLLKNSTLYLFCEESDSDNGFTEVFSLDMNNKTLNWKVSLNGFNMGKPVLKGYYAYMTTIGIVAKLDLKTGKFLYKYEDLYKRGESSFNSFDSIIFNNNQTVFLSKNYLTHSIDYVTVDELKNRITVKK